MKKAKAKLTRVVIVIKNGKPCKYEKGHNCSVIGDTTGEQTKVLIDGNTIAVPSDAVLIQCT